MRSRTSLTCLLAVLLLRLVGGAQVYDFVTPPPAVTAASADWQIQGEPIFYAGAFYFPGGPDVFFDGNVMSRTGVYRGVPLYEDRTLQPYSVVFVPVGGAMMRPYGRRESVASAARAMERLEPSIPAAVATAGAEPPRTSVRETGATDSGGTLESVPAPSGNRGIFVEFEGVRWYSAGPAMTAEPSALRQIGRYHGFPVFADPGGAADRILIPAVPGGSLTPYRR